MQHLTPRSHDWQTLPQPLRDQAEQHWAAYLEAQQPDAERERTLGRWLPWVFALSDFVARVAIRYGEEAVAEVYRRQPGNHQTSLADLLSDVSDDTQAMAIIRRYRHIELSRLACQDLLGELSVPDFLEANSALADALIEQACQWLQRHYQPRWGLAYDDNDEVMPLVVIAMGKLGGCELNFSSDIDLIFCFEAEGETRGGRQSLEHSLYFTRMGQNLIKLLGQQTVDGQAFRVDMRLRPFGQSGPMAVSFSALEDYYQEQGRNWERYAMVKARYLNATERVQEVLFQLLRPFVFRRYIDYSAIEALRKMKLLINQEARRRGVSANIKLGPGGIREVEFIAQTFQLIRGGRDIDLQTRSLLKALHVCEKLNLLNEDSVAELHYAYLLLRKVEHVLQQLRDEQTQTLPSDDTDRMRVAVACGFDSFEPLLEVIKQQMQCVHGHFLNVVGGEEDLEDEDDSELAILWQDLLDDETAQDVLADAGVSDVEGWWKEISDCRRDVRKKSPGVRGRELLATVVPRLIERVLECEGNSELLKRVFTILQTIASRTAYLDLLASNKGALKQLVILCKASPWIAHQIQRYPHLLDELIDPQQLYDLPVLTSYRAQVQEFLTRIPQDDMEAQMEALRQVKQSFQLKVAAADVNDAVPLMKVSDHLTYLAEAVIEQVVWMAWQQLTDRHGAPPGRDTHNTGFAVIAYGKLGGIELGYGSDLDLVFVCDEIPEVQTQGPKPIDAQQFYLRLAQRVLHLFTTRTLSGVLYEVDMRLRPSGSSGLMVVQLSTYASYLQDDAWTWELQALVRARMVFGHDGLARRFASIRAERLQQPRKLDVLRSDICAMREKMRGHLWQSRQGYSDIKQMPGGMTDIEFITQFLVLGYAQQYPRLCEFTDNVRILEVAAEHDLISDDDAAALISSYKVFRAKVHRLALAEQGGLTEHDFSQHTAMVSAIWQRLLEADSVNPDG
ncbi:bifunctional [glutamate--ammonia ligase]-adenylyl-L-tyrosine phosphorylase/[glutamate--ammonia-ligase] adenylyltransferase [Aliidiomarina sedimenti]|uniref:Bifunctional glutamine synthetase adenylyltransferase/adenylyl-removing enzyme n=1 Tax=Aliidiomarina sedimenti TaxID=1933879 RepID=A0ABY0BZQ2_9GAMM|nr:bifunctional [glutamate--ammonia ligase]-adenylyl-L-tyrosine phosphorylase/[glutamate--ammonia-ligase] adenylyltransferase [Aliidiomarina sedimenti]RUO30043.1 bifunctional [glutamate--ammonia ligase]-adenylyl-L-tyrosine phosphorylase/[glutamate--ammonia-ligase] adenylyltransferase [Aliidiomarina sedimenti]